MESGMVVINYCPNCEGHPYTTDSSVTTCPRCGARLLGEMVFDADLVGRPTLGGARTLDAGRRDNEENVRSRTYGDTVTLPNDGTWDDEPTATAPVVGRPLTRSNTSDRPAEGTVTADPRHDVPAVPIAQATPVQAPAQPDPGTTIRGKVSNYSNSEVEAGLYRRFFVQRLVDAVVYGQRFEDLVHRFTVRVRAEGAPASTYVDVPVNVHGTISGGMQLTDNADVEVTGRYKNGVLMARRIAVLNGNTRTYVRFQRAVMPMVVTALLAGIVAFLASGGLDLLAYIGGGIGSFLITWLGVSAIVGVIWAIILSHMGTVAQIMLLRGNFPLIAILGIGLLITLAMTNALGLGGVAVALGDGLLGVVETIAAPAIMLAAIVYLLGLMFR